MKDPLLVAIDRFWKERQSYQRAVAEMRAAFIAAINSDAPRAPSPLEGIDGLPCIRLHNVLEDTWQRIAYRPIKKLRPTGEKILAVPERERVDYLTSFVVCNRDLYDAVVKVDKAATRYYNIRHKMFLARPGNAKAASDGLLFLARIAHGSVYEPGGERLTGTPYLRAFILNCHRQMKRAA